MTLDEDFNRLVLTGDQQIAHAIFENYGVEELFRGIHDMEPELASAALENLLLSDVGRQMLPQLLPVAAGYLQPSPAAPAVQRLAVKTLSVLAFDPDVPDFQLEHIVSLLLSVIKDGDVGAAVIAEETVLKFFYPDQNERLLPLRTLSDMATSDDPIVWPRTISLLVGLTSQGATIFDQLLKNALMKLQCSNDSDVLPAIAALHMLCRDDFVPATASRLVSVVMPKLEIILEHLTPNEPLLLGPSLQAAVSLLSQSEPSPATERWMRYILLKLEHGLSERSESAMDALATLGLSTYGASCIVASNGQLLHALTEGALGEGSSVSFYRLSALHALASIAGAERNEHEILLAPTLEEAFKSSLLSARPALAIVRFIQQPILELHVAVYRALVPLLHRTWCAAEVALHSELLGLLLSSRTETSKQGSEWRYACVLGMHSTLQKGGDGDVLESVAQRVGVSVEAGLYGHAQSPVPQVATRDAL